MFFLIEAEINKESGLCFLPTQLVQALLLLNMNGKNVIVLHSKAWTLNQV